MPYDIPRPSGYRIQPFKLQDDEALVAAMAQQLLKARLAQARAASGSRGGGGGGKSGGSGKGEWRMVYNKDTKRYDKVWVEGKSKADREANIKGMDYNSAADRLEQNPEVSKLLGALRNPGASNLSKQEALKRFNALKSSEDFTGLNKEAVDAAFSQYSKPLEAEVKAEAKKIESSGRLGALGTSLQNAWDRLATWAGSLGSSDEEKIAASKASAERQAARREADPWLREQDLRLAEEPEAQRGIMERTGGLANIATNAAETLISDPGMGLALTGGAVASLGTGGLAAPLVGAGLAATGGAMSGDTFFRERLAQDQNLTDAQRAQAYGEGAMQEQLVGAGLNLIPAVSPAAVRGARVAMAAKGLEGEAAQAARATRAEQLRRFGSVMKADVPLAAGEGAVVNAGQMALSNANYGNATGQQVDLSENVPESALVGLAFGLATGAGSAVGAWRAGRAARQAGTQTSQTPPPSGGGARPGDEATPEGAAAVLAKEAEASVSPQAKGKTQEAPAAAPAERQASEAVAPEPVQSAEPSQPQAPEPVQSAEPSQPQTPEAAASEPVQSSGPAPQDLPSFKKNEAARQKQAGKFEPDLGDAFEAKFRASKEYEGYARYEALRSSLAQSGAGTDAEQASLNAGIARATEGMRQWRERFILDNWDEAKAADKAAKEAKRAAARAEQEVRVAQEDLLKREERRQARPVSSGASNRSDVGWSGRPAQYGDWRDSIVPLPENAARVRFDRDTPPPVEVPATTQAASLETTGAGANEEALILRLADIMGASRRKAEAAEAAEAKPADKAKPAAKGGKKGAVSPKVASPFNTRQLGIIYTFSKKNRDAVKNALIQKNTFLQGSGILDKIDAARKAFDEALGGADYVYVDEATGRRRILKNDQLMQSFDQLAERLQALGYKRGGNDKTGNAGSQPDTALRTSGRLGEEVSHSENTGVHRGVEADTAPDAEASANRASKEAGVRGAKDQGERDSGGSGERSAEAPDSESGVRIKRAERESGSEESLGERGSEQPAETGARAGEGERGAEPAADAVAGGPAAGRSPAETIADAVQPYLDYATLRPVSKEYYNQTGLNYYGKAYPDIDGADSIRETFKPFYAKGRHPESGRPDYWEIPKPGTEDYNWAVLNTLDPPFRDAQSRNFKFETSRWKDTPFSPEFFQTNFPDAWKSGKLDYDDVRMVMDPDSVRVENEAVLNGDKPVCS